MRLANAAPSDGFGADPERMISTHPASNFSTQHRGSAWSIATASAERDLQSENPLNRSEAIVQVVGYDQDDTLRDITAPVVVVQQAEEIPLPNVQTPVESTQWELDEANSLTSSNVATRSTSPIEARLSWDNVEGAPVWLSDCRPKYHDEFGMHVVALAPSARTRFLVPEYATLRIVNPREKMVATDLHVWVSEGSGVFRLHHPAVSEKGHSLVVSPSVSRPSVVVVERPASADCQLEVAFFVSRTDHPTPSTPHCAPVLAGCGAVRITRARDHRVEEFLRMPKGKWLALAPDVGGQLVIETRLVYPTLESQRHQTYQLLARLDGQPARVIDFETTVESRERLTAGGACQVLGRLETQYLCVPEHVAAVEFNSTADLLIRVRSCVGCGCEKNNRHRPACGPACAAHRFPVTGKTSIWDFTPNEVSNSIHVGADACFPMDSLLRIARDNDHLHGGLSSWALARAQAARWLQEPGWRDTAQQIEGMHTSFLHVPPRNGGADHSQYFAWYYTARPKALGLPDSSHFVSQQHVSDLVERGMPSGIFSVIPHGIEQPLVYHLPSEDRPSTMRLAFDRRFDDAPCTLFVQMNDRTPVVLRVGRANDLRPDHYDPSMGEQALAGLRSMHGPADIGTLGGPFSQIATPSVYIPAGTTSMLVPGDTQVVRIWSAEPTKIAVALNYRTSRPFQLSERAYLELAQREGIGSQTFWDAMANPMRHSNPSFAGSELHNHWRPLMRLLRSHERQFVGAVDALHRDTAIDRRPPDISLRLDLAREATRNENWVMSAENWAKVIQEADGSIRQEATAGQLHALVMQGEHFLAGRVAHGLYLYDEDPNVQETARRFLFDQYLANEDLRGLETLAATSALRQPHPERILELAQVLYDNERFDFALLVASTLPAGQQPTELLVRCAYQIRWWSVFHDLVQQLPSTPQQNFWKAHWFAHRGDYDRALEHFQNAGPPGHAFAEKLQEGQKILRSLRGADMTQRANGILAWERWTASLPGRRIWKEDETLIRQSLGGDLLYSIDRDLKMRFYRASKREPVLVVVQGPARIKIVARPRHGTVSDQPIDDWLNIRTAGQHYVFPINANAKSHSIKIIGDDTHAVGRAIEGIVELSAGRHELLVHADRTDLLVQAKVERPELLLPILPVINIETMRAALAGQLQLRTNPCWQETEKKLALLAADGCICLQPFVYSASDTSWNVDRALADVEANLAARMTLRSEGSVDWYQAAIVNLATQSSSLAPQERLLAFQRSGAIERADTTVLGPFRLPPPLLDAYLMATNRLPDLNPVANVSSMEARRRAVLLAHAADHLPDRRGEFAIRGRQLLQQHLTSAQLQQLESRLTWSLRWERVEQVDRSAGVFSRALTRWDPESPTLRNRVATTHDLDDHDHVLSGADALVLDTREVESTTLEVAIQPISVGYVRQTPTVVVYEVNGSPQGTVDVRPGTMSRFKIELEPGKHQIVWRIENPRLGQTLRMAIASRANARGEAIPVSPETERRYHVATRSEPVEFSVTGPTALRVDEFADGTTSTRYIHVGGTRETITLKPSENSERGLFRVFESVHDPERRRLYALDSSVAPQPVPVAIVGSIELPTESGRYGDVQLAAYQEPDEVGSLALLPADADSVMVNDVDQRVLGAQEDGTWDLGSAWFQRQLLEESTDDTGIDKFLEFHASHRIFDEYKDRYLRNRFLLRTRESSGPTFAFQHRGWWEPDNGPWSFDWGASAFTQRPIPTNALTSRDQEWALEGRISISRSWFVASCVRHSATLTFFGRDLTLDQNPYGPVRVDQDVFTKYKRDHQHGLRLSDRWVWEQYEDRRWWASPRLSTNENLGSVDLWGVQAGVQQAVGRLDFDLSYRFTEFEADKDRRRDISQHLLFVDAHFHRWSVLGRRVELSTRIRQDLGNGRTSGNLMLSWYFDRGRHYRDFHSSELRFPELRKQRAEYENTPWLLE